MNENANQSSPVPPLLPGVPPTEEWKADYRELGKPLTVLTVAEEILKHPCRVLYEMHHGKARPAIACQAIIAVFCLVAYGVTVGMFSWQAQIWAAPLKITLGVLLSALICLPSLFVFSCLAGIEAGASAMVGGLAGLVTVSALLMLAFAPVSWLFGQSTESVAFMGALHLVFWGVAVGAGLQFLRKSAVLLNVRQGAHLATWAILFVVVTLQMSTTLRPIVGSSDRLLQTEKKFFLSHWNEQLSKGNRR